MTIIVLQGHLNPTETLESYTKSFIGSVEKKYQNFKLEKEENFKLTNYPAKKLIYEVGVGTEAFKSITYLMLGEHNSRAFLLTFSSLPSKFNKLKRQFEKTAKTLKVR